MKNPLIKKILIIVGVSIISVLLIFYVLKLILNSNSLTYDLGENFNNYSDVILKEYDDYEKFVKDYGIKKDLALTNFSTKYYVASFQDYDSCAEKQKKYVHSVNKEGNILNISYDVYNSCGMCKKHTILYLIEIDKYTGNDPVINYSYNYVNNLSCGKV